MCVDLPIFSIHGNHDDPTRDGGTEMLAALDLLAVNHLVNYFGRHDEVDKVQVSPVLIKKGETKVALYGMGSMRDERLNRMWQGKKVRFLRPNPDQEDENDDSEDDASVDDKNGWFNIFALHQNRDLGRGSKNCVHESMIPEWMDLVVWGHEHESLITPSESAVGTYRITQPGSSVATSLTEGESMRKHVGILDIRGSQFRMTAVPLMQVRSFTMGHITLSESNLDPEDTRIDEAMRELLAKEVEKIVAQAREDSRLLKKDAQAVAGEDGDGDGDITKKLHYHVEKPEQVLVRLKVEHSGFTTLHNQRFGSQFVNDVVSSAVNSSSASSWSSLTLYLLFDSHTFQIYVLQANPSDILLFHRKRTTDATSSNKKKKSTAEKGLYAEPIPPEDLDEINIDDIVKDTLGSSEKKLMILDESRLSIAVEEFVNKEQKGTIAETVAKIVSSQQKKLVKRGINLDGDGDGDGTNKVTTANAVREVCQADTQRARDEDDQSMVLDDDEDEDEERSAAPSSKRKSKAKAAPAKAAPAKKRSRAASISDSSELDDVEPPKKKAATKTKTTKSTATTRAKKTTTAAKKRSSNYDDSDDDDEIEEIAVAKAAPKRRPVVAKAAPKRRPVRNATVQKKRYAVDDSDDEDEIVDDGDDSDIEIVEKPAARRNGGKSKAPPKRGRTAKSYNDDSDDDVDDSGMGWGTAGTK